MNVSSSSNVRYIIRIQLFLSACTFLYIYTFLLQNILPFSLFITLLYAFILPIDFPTHTHTHSHTHDFSQLVPSLPVRFGLFLSLSLEFNLTLYLSLSVSLRFSPSFLFSCMYAFLRACFSFIKTTRHGQAKFRKKSSRETNTWATELPGIFFHKLRETSVVMLVL